MRLPYFRSRLSSLGRSGQFAPIAGTLIFTSLILLYAVTNIFRVARAKLQAQNLADATVLAMASLQAKSINTVIDRDEWLNHLYPENTPKNNDQLPGISDASNGRQHKKMPDDEARNYAQLIFTINKAQMMFTQAYNNFMGASQDGSAGTQTMNSGLGSLSEILSEITGLNDPSVVQVIVFNSESDANNAESQADKFIHDRDSNILNSGRSQNVLQPAGTLHPVEFDTEDVSIQTKDSGTKTLTQLLFPKGPPDPNLKVGWMHPKWDKNGFTMPSGNGTEKQIGSGAIVVKSVRMLYFKTVYVQAKSVAYVVKKSGRSMGDSPTRAPDHFRPTYYVQLGQPK